MLDTIYRKWQNKFSKTHPNSIRKNERFPGLRQLPNRVKALEVDLSFEGTMGWLSANERRALYALAYWLEGPMLEIGSWAGLSTSCIATGIRDSGRPTRFISNDLNPSVKNFHLNEDAISMYISSDPRSNMGIYAPKRVYVKEILPILESPGGVIGCLKRNLQRYKLSNYVEIEEGDFRNVVPHLGYRFIFCDCSHNAAEIQANAPRLLPLMAPKCVLAFHDTTSANEKRLRSLIPINDSCRVDSLFVAMAN